MALTNGARRFGGLKKVILSYNCAEASLERAKSKVSPRLFGSNNTAMASVLPESEADNSFLPQTSLA
jgi:hypothetical protein